MTRTLVLSTTFPQYTGDPRGEFILRHWQARAAAGEEVRMLVPRTAWSDAAHDPGPAGFDVRRVSYAPRALSSLTGRFGILENIREQPARALLVPALAWAMRRALLEEIERARPQRVVAHMLLPCGAIVAELCRARGIPFVLYGHGTDVDLAIALPGPLHRWMGAQLSAAELVYVPSADKRARLLARWPGLGLRVQVETMSHCVAVPSAEVTPRSPVDHEILFLGRLIRQKGVDDLLAAVSRMRPRPQVEIAGDGPERRRLERLAARLGVRARFHGFVQGEQKARLLRGAAVVCVPSRETAGGLSEGAPLVIREAFAYGVPVVATRVGGIPELCDGGAAWLVSAGRPAELRDALASALSVRGLATARVAAAASGLC